MVKDFNEVWHDFCQKNCQVFIKVSKRKVFGLNSKLTTRDLAYMAMAVALIAICSWISIPTTVPFTMQTFAVCLVSALLGTRRGFLAVACYLLLGAVGAPVFAGFKGGLGALLGVTGGYLVGYLPCAFLSGVGGEQREKTGWWFHALMMAAGTFILYAVGTVVFMLHTGNALGAALSLCVIPFLPGDAVKIAAAVMLTVPVRKAVYSIHNS